MRTHNGELERERESRGRTYSGELERQSRGRTHSGELERERGNQEGGHTVES